MLAKNKPKTLIIVLHLPLVKFGILQKHIENIFPSQHDSWSYIPFMYVEIISFTDHKRYKATTLKRKKYMQLQVI